MRNQTARTGFVPFLLTVCLSLFANGALAAKYCAYFVSTNTPFSMGPGQDTTVDITVQNCGSWTWPPQGPEQVFISYHWYQGNKSVIWKGEQTGLNQYVYTGDQIQAKAKLVAPKQPGQYTLKWDLVHVDKNKQQHWFSKGGSKTKDYQVAVMPPVIGTLLQSLQPKILAVHSLSGADILTQLRPNLTGWLAGSWFGEKKGKMKLSLPSGKEVPALVHSWTDLGVHFGVPDIVGEKKGKLALWIETAEGLSSNKITLDFAPAQELIKIHGDFIKVIDCDGGKLSRDSCQIYTALGYTFGAWHYTSCCINADDGVDKYAFTRPLANGWVYHSHSFKDDSPKKCIGSCAYAKLSMPAAKGATDVSFEVEWSTGTVWNDLVYTGDIYIMGPKGVGY